MLSKDQENQILAQKIERWEIQLFETRIDREAIIRYSEKIGKQPNIEEQDQIISSLECAIDVAESKINVEES